MKNKKTLIAIGTSVIAVSFLLIGYFVLISLGIIQTRMNRLTIKSDSIEVYYNGTEQTMNQYEITSGKLMKNHRLTVHFEAGQTNVGLTNNVFSIEIYDSNDAIVTSEYDITLLFGTISVIPRPITIKTNTRSKSYDGTSLYEHSWHVKEGSLLENHIIDINFYSEIIEVGKIDNEATVFIYDENNSVVNQNYTIQYDYGFLEVTRIKLTFESFSNSKEYDGLKLTKEEYALTKGAILEGHFYDIEFISEIILPGIIENRYYVRLFEENNDVSNYYDVEYEYGTLEIRKIPIRLVSESSYKLYDGKPLESKSYSVDEQSLLKNHTIDVQVVGSITHVGSNQNRIVAYIYDEEGKDVTYTFYDLLKEEGTLTIFSGYYSSGNISDEMIDVSVQNVMSVFSSKTETVYLRENSYGDYNFSGFDQPKSYLTNLTNPLSYVSSVLRDNNYKTNELVVEMINDILPYQLPYFSDQNLNSYNDTYTNIPFDKSYSTKYYSYNYFNDPSLRINDQTLIKEEEQYRKFVYETYLDLPESTKSGILEIAYNNGINESNYNLIYDIKDYIQNAAVYNIEYSRTPSDVDYVLYFLNVALEGICQHYAAAATVMYRAFGIPARYTVGYKADAIANQWVDVTLLDSHAWVEIYIDGLGWVPIEVTGFDNSLKGELTIQPKSLSKIYDGTPLFATEILGFEELSNAGYTYTASLVGEITDIGEVETRINNFSIYNEDGVNVTSQFDIFLKKGTLKIYLHTAELKTYDLEKTYDGTSLINQDNSMYEIYGLQANHYVGNVKFTGSQETVGSSSNSALPTIYNEFGEDVTDEYLFINYFGKLEVNVNEITIRSYDGSKVFDGSKLEVNEFEIIGNLAPGEFVELEFKGIQIGVGVSENTISNIKIIRNQLDVTKNYNIKLLFGKLTVYPSN